MRHFPILQSKRLTLQLQELSFQQSLELAAMPVHLYEAATTKFLGFVIKTNKGIASPHDWTVQERLFVVAHYLACTLEENNPNFSLGMGNYLDYLNKEAELSASFSQIELGQIADDEWVLGHLTGCLAESIERLEGQVLTGRNHWLIGSMAAQLAIKGDIENSFNSNEELDDWLLSRIKTFLAYPESAFENLFIAYRIHQARLQHLFSIDFDDNGIITLPKEVDGSLPPARFPVSKLLSRTARDFIGIVAK